MKAAHDDPSDAALAALAALARRSAPPASSALLGRGWFAVVNRLATRDRRRRALRRWSLVGATVSVVVVAAAALVASWHKPVPPLPPVALSYRIEGGSVIDGGYLKEAGNAGIKLHFVEGTDFLLAPGTRGRLRSVDAVGARIAIEQGTASFRVTPQQNAHWMVDVGPFLVTVKGTAFTISWDAASERFELKMQHGQVQVTGPVSQGSITLRAGQRLAVNLPKHETLITEHLREREDPAPAKGSALAGDHETVAATPSGPAPAGSSKASPRRNWSDAVAAGDWDLILADVDRTGVRRTLRQASSEDLFAVADAARYRRRTALAREALLAERTRFPGTTRALDALFLLGRLAEADRAGAGKALAWYDEYLRRAPSGTYAAEALGRKMMATSERDGEARARPIAEEYLRRFPSGTYAGTARALLAAR